MAVVYRGMNEEQGTGKPVLSVPPGSRSLALMARVRLQGDTSKRRADIEANADGMVEPETGGMSVNTTLVDIPHFFVPARLKGVPPLRNGTAGDDCRIWSHRVAEVPGVSSASTFAGRLSLRMGPGNHGLVEPSEAMHHAAYSAAIAATRPNWRLDEPSVPTKPEVTP